MINISKDNKQDWIIRLKKVRKSYTFVPKNVTLSVLCFINSDTLMDNIQMNNKYPQKNC
jgi:hypothetical protein